MKSFQHQKVLESSVCLVGQALEERALAWSSPFKLAKMITIWPQNRCISPGLAGNRDFVFPLRMACLHPPSSSDVGSSKGGQTITLGRKPVYSSKDFAQKKLFLKIKDMFAIAGGFWTKSDSKVSAAVSRLVLEACPSMVRWLGDHSGLKLAPSDLKLALESF